MNRLRIATWTLDSEDPRAPTSAEWAAMSPDERERVVEALPSEFTKALPEGDVHRAAKQRALDPLQGFFERIGRRVYLSSELPVYYPAEPMFAPDLIAVIDVESHARDKWVVEREEKGLDLVLEVHVAGHRSKDLVRNVEWFARLGITEYFVYEPLQSRIRGWVLPDPSAKTYRPLLGQAGRFRSTVLGLDLGIEGETLRFFYGEAAVPETRELLMRANALVSDISSKYEAAIRRAEEVTRQLEEEARLRAEEARLRAEAERRLEEALAELERLKR